MNDIRVCIMCGGTPITYCDRIQVEDSFCTYGRVKCSNKECGNETVFFSPTKKDPQETLAEAIEIWNTNNSTDRSGK